MSASRNGPSTCPSRASSASFAEASATTLEIRQTSALAATKAKTVAVVTGKAERIAETGQRSLEASIIGLEEIRRQTETIVTTIVDLAERTLRVGEIIETVKDLADQSNVLALNAAIDAAKAGEFGKGFGVVAREIRTLADQSIKATGRIREILLQIQGAIRTAVTITEEGQRRMEASVQEIGTSGENLREMTGIVNESSQAARQIASIVDQQDSGITQISQAIASLSAGMEETTGGVQVVEASVQNLTAIAQKVAALVDSFKV